MRASKTLIAGLFLLSGAPAWAQPGLIDADPAYQRAYQPRPEGPPPEEGGGPSWNSGLNGYVGLRGSLALNNNKVTTYEPGAPPAAIRASFATGGGGSVYIGTRLPLNLRLELEGLYRWQPLSRVNLAGVEVPGFGSTRVAAPMVNLLWDIPMPVDALLQPFVGMGVGAAYTETNVFGGGNTYMKSNRWDLAYSFMGGVALPLNDSSRLTAMYRWMQVRNAGHKCASSGATQNVCLNNNVNSLAVDVGLEMDL